MSVTANLPSTISVSIAKVDTTFDLKLDAMPDDVRDRVVSYLIAHGLKQTLGDRVADPKLSGDEAIAAIEARLAKLQDGTFSEAGARGPRKSPVDAETCKVVFDLLRQAGWKADAARKATATVRDAAAGFKVMLAQRLKAAGKPSDEGAVGGAFNTNWPKIVATAKANVERAARLDLSL